MSQPHRWSDATGAAYVEVIIALALVAAMTTSAVPVTGAAIDASRARNASGFLAARLRLARQHAATRSASTGVVFDLTGSGWTIRVCTAGNGNGIRRADIAAGTDTCAEGPFSLAQQFPGVEVGVDARLPGPDGEPGSADPVRFGRSNIASFSPEGTATAGTVFLRTKCSQYAIRVNNVTGRTRLLRYNPGTRAWGNW